MNLLDRAIETQHIPQVRDARALSLGALSFFCFFFSSRLRARLGPRHPQNHYGTTVAITIFSIVIVTLIVIVIVIIGEDAEDGDDGGTVGVGAMLRTRAYAESR